MQLDESWASRWTRRTLSFSVIGLARLTALFSLASLPLVIAFYLVFDARLARALAQLACLVFLPVRSLA